MFAVYSTCYASYLRGVKKAESLPAELPNRKQRKINHSRHVEAPATLTRREIEFNEGQTLTSHIPERHCCCPAASGTRVVTGTSTGLGDLEISCFLFVFFSAHPIY